MDVLFPSVFSGTARLEFRQPLLAGAGRQFTGAAGPIGQAIDGVSGVSQGVLIAKNNSKIASLDLQIHVATFLRDVSVTYWQLTNSRENLTVVQKAIDELDQWNQNLRARKDANAGVAAIAELEMRELQTRLRGDLLAAQRAHDLLQIRFRRLLGMVSNDESKSCFDNRWHFRDRQRNCDSTTLFQFGVRNLRHRS